MSGCSYIPKIITLLTYVRVHKNLFSHVPEQARDRTDPRHQSGPAGTEYELSPLLLRVQ